MQQASNEISNNRTCVICHLPSSVIITISIGNTITISIGNAIILRSMSIDNRVSANRCSTSRDGAAATSSRGPCRSLSHPGARPLRESGSGQTLVGSRTCLSSTATTSPSWAFIIPNLPLLPNLQAGAARLWKSGNLSSTPDLLRGFFQ